MIDLPERLRCLTEAEYPRFSDAEMDRRRAAMAVGLLVATFAVAQLTSAPLWGRFSDRYGRRPALMIGLGSSAIAYVLFAYANSLELLFLLRLVQGAGGGTVGVIQAYVADATKPEDRSKALGWLSAATNAGVALGPVLGRRAGRARRRRAASPRASCGGDGRARTCE